MARKKEEISTIDTTTVEETTPDVVIEKEETTPDVDVKDSAEEEIPFNVKRILKLFNNYPELYINNAGGVFTPSAKHSLRGNAILYKNPYYNYKSK